ncbi:MAG: hypothetical protein DMF93_15155 [Acidobacteria bacterium]|nr:MAG: hypothetical protein DMF93_15155 [Acidobacteriota bacterium]
MAATKHDEDGYPAELESQLTLAGGRRVRIRALHTCEAEPIRALHCRLSDRSRYLRFLSPMPALPDSVLRALACVDHRRSVAIVAEEALPGGAVIGLASFSAVDAAAAEVAVVVQDDWQGRGVGDALVATLLAAAEARGFHRFLASIAADNGPMRRLLARYGRVLTSEMRSGVSEIAFEPHRPQGARTALRSAT